MNLVDNSVAFIVKLEGDNDDVNELFEKNRFCGNCSGDYFSCESGAGEDT